MKTYYISGHLDLTPEEFRAHYETPIRAAYDEGSGFLVGDARGADTMAQEFLKGLGCDRVIVYHMFEKPRNNLGFSMYGGFPTDGARDEAMTLHSEEDIAWVRPGREKSGTAQNLERRKK